MLASVSNRASNTVDKSRYRSHRN